MERVRRVAAVRARVGQRADDVEELDDRARPAVREQQRQRVRLGRAHVQEVDVLPVDLGGELRVARSAAPRARASRSRRASTRPGPCRYADGHAAAPADAGQLVRPAGPGEPVAQVVQVGLRDVDAEGADLVVFAHVANARNLLGQLGPSVAGRLADMLETSARLLRAAVPACRPAATGPAPELAERLGVTTPHRPPRRRPAARASATRCTPPPGVAGGYRLGAGAALPPLLLDDDEAVAVAVGPAHGRRRQRSPASRRPRCGRWPSSSRCCRPGCATGSTRCRRMTVPMAGAGPTVDAGHADRHRRRLPRPRAAALRLPRPTTAPSAPARPSRTAWSTRAALVPGRLGRRPAGLAHLPRRPARAAHARPARASPRARRRTPTSAATRHGPSPRRPTATGPGSPCTSASRRRQSGSRPPPGRWSRSTSAAARCGQGRTRWTSWRST